MNYHIQRLMFSSKRLDHGTPEDLFRQLNREFNFTLDVCADSSNAMVKNFLTEDDNALETPWTNEICWMNPPYGREIPQWIKKAFREARDNNATVVCLVPARTDTRWFWDYCVHGEIRFIKGRLRFKGEKSSAPFPSMAVIFRPQMFSKIRTREKTQTQRNRIRARRHKPPRRLRQRLVWH